MEFGSSTKVLSRRALWSDLCFKKIIPVALWKLDGGRWEVWEKKQGDERVKMAIRKSGWIQDMFWRLSWRNLLTDWLWSANEREIKHNAYIFGLANCLAKWGRLREEQVWEEQLTCGSKLYYSWYSSENQRDDMIQLINNWYKISQSKWQGHGMKGQTVGSESV